MKKAIKMLGVLSVLLLCTSVADAQRTTTRTTTTTYDESEGNFAMRLNASTLGAGLEGILKLSEQLNGRVGVNGFEYEYDGTESGVDYDFGAMLFNVAALLDWFPTEGGSFHFSGGAVFNQNELEAEGTGGGTYTIGDTTYAGVNTLHGDVEFNEVAPYLGLGWGQPFGKEGNWSLNFEVGAMYQGEPDVTLTASGPATATPGFSDDLASEESELEEELDDYQFYPVVALGVAYRF